MGRIWTEENKYRCWLQVESAASTVLAEDGVIPAAAAQAIATKASFSVDRIQEIEAEVKHDVIAFTTAVAESLKAQGLEAESRWLHYGLTSNDIVDTAQALQVKEASEHIRKGLLALAEVLKRRALEFKHTPTIGRTHGIHAEPTTFGLKLLNWYAEMQRNLARFDAAADVVDLARTRAVDEFGKRFDQIETVNVIADLFSLVTEQPIWSATHSANHQVRQKTMQLGSGVRRSSQTTAAKGNSRHSEIPCVFLDENVRCNFRSAEERMLCVIDTHRLRNATLVFVPRLYFPSLLEFTQRQTIRGVAVDFVRRSENERCLRRKLSRRFQQIQRSVRVHSEISLRIARSPIV